jgi:outer membrane protein TolC
VDPFVPLVTLESAVAPIYLVPLSSIEEMISLGLANRPEVAAGRELVAEASRRRQRELRAPWLPNVVVGMDYGAMGGGLGDEIANSGDRFDFDAAAVWEVRNAGFGEQAARRQALAGVEQAQSRYVQTTDAVAREVVEAYAVASAGEAQIEVAQSAVVSAVPAYRRTQVRIRAGQGLPIEAVQSLLALDEARREYLRAVADFNEGQFRLYRALGWAPLSHSPPVSVAARTVR